MDADDGGVDGEHVGEMPQDTAVARWVLSRVGLHPPEQPAGQLGEGRARAPPEGGPRELLIGAEDVAAMQGRQGLAAADACGQDDREEQLP